MDTLLYPASIDWEVTPFCNHNCIHCYNCWRSINDKSCDVRFNQEVSSDWFNRIAGQIIKSKPVSVIITGGEPLSVYWQIEEAMKLLIQSGIYVSMNTNLTLMNDAIAESIKKMGIHIFTSIPSADPVICDQVTGIKGSFQRIDEGIKLCLRYNIPLATNMVVTKLNEVSIAATAKYIKSLGMNYFCCTKAAFPANANEDLRHQILSHDEFSEILSSLIEIGKDLNLDVDSAWAYSLCGLDQAHIPYFGFKRRCGAGRFNFAVTYTGDIKACNVDTVVYGNILTDEFSVAINRMTDWQTNVFLPVECQKCQSLYLCGGGCRLEAENSFGDKCHLDSTAEIANIERTVTPPQLLPVNRKAQFQLNNDVCFVKEAICYRVSRRSHYEFISSECRDFFETHAQFTFHQFRDELGLTDELAEYEFNEFIDKQFVVEI